MADLLAQFIILFGISSIFGCQSRLWFIATFEHVISWQVFLAHNGAIKQSKKGCQQHERLLLLTVFPYRGRKLNDLAPFVENPVLCLLISRKEIRVNNTSLVLLWFPREFD